MLEAGQRAPSFSLDAGRGESRSLEALLAGGPVLLVFVEADCPTSRLALERLERARVPLEEKGVTLVAIHEDAPEVAERTMRHCRADFLALAEPDPYAVSAAYGLRTVPTAFLVARDASIERVIEGWSHDDYVVVLAEAARSSKEEAAQWLAPAAPPMVKPGCGSKNTLAPELRASVASSSSSFDEIEDMFERGWTDGLPVVPPTRSRVRAMLGDYVADVSLGPVPPGMGELTLERLAACAVLAGCHPTYFPVVKAAAEAALDPAFNLHGVTNTTHSCGPVLIVNGPVRRRIGMNAGINCLGGWNRANATIGRAIRLMTGLTGRGLPGSLDRAALGQPGKISFCFAENEEQSPWESLAATRGVPEGRSAVTVYAGDGPTTVSDHYSRDPGDTLTTLAVAGGAAFSPHFYPVGGDTVFVLCLEHARMFAGAGWTKREVAERIVEGSKRRVGDMRRGEQGPFARALDDDAVLAKWMSADEVVIVVAGGDAGRFSAILAPWVGFGLGSGTVTRLVDEA
ncbi:MAG: peroxiredoxin family protein [Candidatus Binatia bacterium]